MLESASPRNPRLLTRYRSSTERILLVAWRKNAFRTCSFSIPPPLSVTRIKEQPPSLISTVTAFAPASMAFSTSSFTTLDGRSTTSPAAILSMVLLSSSLISAICVSFLHRCPALARNCPAACGDTAAYHLFFSLFCRRYRVFRASSGVMVLTSTFFSSSSTSASVTVSNRDICSRSNSS